MADNEEVIEFEIKEETAAKPSDDIVIESAEEPKVEKKKREVSPREGIQDLKQKLEMERLARFEAENRERAASAWAANAQNEVSENQRQLVSNTLDFVKQERAGLKSAYSQALAAGDFDAAAEINDRIADIAAKILDLENGKAAMEAQAQQPRGAPQQQGDVVEQFASRLTPRSASWVRAHPDFVRDPRLNQKMIAAHQMAVADGVQADSDEYFDYVEDILKIKGQAHRSGDDEEAMSAAAKTTQRRSSPSAAPVSRSAMSSDGSRPNVVTLTAEEREFAEMNRQSPEEYARNKLRLIREGRLNNGR
jgi:hypothetical protein